MEGVMVYRYEAASENAFVQQLAVAYVNHGYWYYVAGVIPPDKDVKLVDDKLMEKYGIGISKWRRARRKSQGLANVHYLRCQRFFVLIASAGWHPFYEAEGPEIRDIRREPIRFAGYSIGYRRGVRGKWHASVRIHPEQYSMFKSYLLDICTHRSVEQIQKEFRDLPFEPYAPVRRQFLNILRAVNRARRTAGLGPVPVEALRLRRRILKPFLEEEYGVLTLERESDGVDLKEGSFSEELQEYRTMEVAGRRIERGIAR